MTLIFGINLSDRVYVASDSRVTYSNEHGRYFKDCVCKNVPLNGNLIVSAAGDAKLASYLFEKLKKEKFIENGINVVKDKLKSWAAKEINDYYLKGNCYTTVCLIIAGIDKSKRKKISGKQYIDLVKEFQKIRRTNNQLSMNDTVFRGISSKPNQPNPEPELPVADSSVIALQSDIKNNVLEVEDAGFGSYLAYGPGGFRKNDVPRDLFGRLEFEQGDMVRDMVLLTAFISSIAEEKKFATVGGSIVVNSVSETQGILLPTGKVHRLNPETGEEKIISLTEINGGKLYGKTESGIMIRLIDFNKYKSGKSHYFL